MEREFETEGRGEHPLATPEEPVIGPLTGVVIQPFGKSLRADTPNMTYREVDGWLVREDGQRIRPL